MERILANCRNIYTHLQCCHTDSRPCDCSCCLTEGFYGGSDTYTCVKKLCYYVMRYGSVYTNEIYYFLKSTGLLENYFIDDLKVISLGCGFGPDYIALSKYINDKGINLQLKYVGYDKEVRWKKITDGIYTNLPSEKDLMQGFSLAGYNLIFLNKIFSTLKSIGQHQQFLDILVESILHTMQQGAILVFNDVNHISMGRDYFHSVIANIIGVEGKYYFNVDGAYSGNYQPLSYSSNICTMPSDLPISPYRTVNKTVFFVYRKE